MRTNRLSGLMWPMFNYQRHLPQLGKVHVKRIIIPTPQKQLYVEWSKERKQVIFLKRRGKN